MPTSPLRPRLVLIAAGVALVLVAAATWIVLGTRDTATTVRLEAVVEPGAAPYTVAVGRDQPDVVPPADPGGPRAGDSPGLYGQTDAACDPAALAAALRDNGRAVAWARAAGRPDGDAAAVIRALTPLVLRVDVLVDEHEWVAAADSTYRAVLQAGSAVLVDDRGLPRVRCAGGNPLASPSDPLGDDLTGAAWRWFTPSGVATVTPAAGPLATFAVIDLDSGAVVTIPVRR